MILNTFNQVNCLLAWFFWKV